ncbi:MAG: hypothetical protein ACAI38_08115 [Myxococcota bacterium]
MKIKVLSLVLMGTLAVAPACGGDGGSESPEAAAMPSAEMMSLALESSENSAALTEDPSMTDAIAQELVSQLDDAIALLHPRLDAVREGAEPVRDGEGCAVWTKRHEGVAYELRVCRRDGRAEHYAFVLRGRPADSTTDEDYVRLVAGHGTALPRFDGGRRGFGIVGYNFTGWNRLRGSGPVGEVAIGYRVAGRARTLNAAYRDFASSAELETHSARLAYHHVVGVGGRIAFGVGADLIAPGETEGTYVIGQDELNERVRLAMAWARGVGARVVGSACGGTVGDGCISVAQCYSFDTAVTFEDVRSGNTRAFEERDCPRLDIELPAIPTEGDVAAGGDTDADVPGPDVNEPVPSIDE